MQTLTKIWQRLTDPVFYRKRTRQVIRYFKKGNLESRLKSVEALGQIERAVVVVAHPDDETFCSGLILELTSQGTVVDLVCLTRGEGGPTGAWSREELGQVRESEMKNACRELGIHDLLFLDHIDPIAREHRVFAPDVSVADLAAQLSPLVSGAELVVTHGSSGEYWHPAHLLVHEAVKIAIGDQRWMTFLAARDDHPIPKLVNLDDPAHLLIDVSGHTSTREKALGCHESQVSLFCRFGDGTLSDFIWKTSTETYCLRGPEIG
ncbi:MAG: PIG-L deacetylase family protein [Verrucomicrobiota bacterium]